MTTAKTVLLLSIDCRQALWNGALEAQVGGLRIFPHFAFTLSFSSEGMEKSNWQGRNGMCVCSWIVIQKDNSRRASALSKSWSIANGWAPALSAEARKMQQKGRWVRRLIWFKSPLCCWPIAGHVTSLLRCKRGFFTHCWVLPLQKNMWAFFFVFLLNSSSLTLSI